MPDLSNAKLLANKASKIKLIQITDTHILDEDAASFNDYDTTASLNKIVETIRQKEEGVDLILLTGDLIHEPTKTSYQKLADSLMPLTAPLYCLPGNHDDPEMMEYVMGANGFESNKVLSIGNWLIILLNTRQEGEHAGYLIDTELEFLQDTLASNPDCHCLIALHHHPLSIDSPWMDAMLLTNGDALFNIIKLFSNVKVMIWGHIHQEFDMKKNDMQLYGTPSTCLQFVPHSDAFAVDDKGPAYRRLILTDNGQVKSKVVYLK